VSRGFSRNCQSYQYVWNSHKIVLHLPTSILTQRITERERNSEIWAETFITLLLLPLLQQTPEIFLSLRHSTFASTDFSLLHTHHRFILSILSTI
jgi:hypothetical protein